MAKGNIFQCKPNLRLSGKFIASLNLNIMLKSHLLERLTESPRCVLCKLRSLPALVFNLHLVLRQFTLPFHEAS